VHPPPFLTELLKTYRSEQNDHFHEHLFAGVAGGLLRRTNFRCRVRLPAVAGDTRRGWAPILPGLHFHDLRHTHKNWLIEDGVPEVLQHERPGQRMPGIRGTYSYVTHVMANAMLDGLPRRWERSAAAFTRKRR
jgi:integrase